MVMSDVVSQIKRLAHRAWAPIRRFGLPKFGWQASDWRRLGRLIRQFNIRRPVNAALVGLLVASIAAPLVNILITDSQYWLTTADQHVVSPAAPHLLSKLAYDASKQATIFNADGETQTASSSPDQLSASAGAGGNKDSQLYTATMPDNAAAGITINDNVNQVPVTFKPQFALQNGRKGTGRVDYPLSDGSGQLIFTPKGNGVKEDILLKNAPKNDTASYTYDLDLPAYLQARLNDDGSVGIYSGDPQLFGKITYGTDKDHATVEKAREQSAKDYEMFTIPAPTIKQYGRVSKETTAAFTLNGNKLTVSARGLAKAGYPLSIDPTFVLSSTSDWVLGSVDDNIDLTTAGQIGRSTLDGGSVNGWTVDTSSLANGDYAAGLVAYNSALYLIGGGNQDGTTNNTSTTQVMYVLLNSNGTQNGTWTVTSALNTARQGFVAFGFNGYLYAVGGDNSSSAALNSVEYAKINTNGSVGTWTTSTNSLHTARGYPAGGIYQGVMYVMGGASGTLNASLVATTEYARINGDGTVGTWTLSTSSATGTLPTATDRFQGGAYNGFVYAAGGLTGTPAVVNTVEYAPIQSDGSLGAWVTSTPFPTARRDQGIGVINGHIYVYAGCSSATLPCATASLQPDTEYAVINADGSVGQWQRTEDYNFNSGTAPYGPRVDPSSAFYNGYLHFVGGCNGEASVSTDHCTSAGLRTGTFYTGIDVPGRFDKGIQSVQTTPPYNNTTPSSSRSGAQTVVSNGYIYYISGCSVSNCTNYDSTVDYAPINADGSLGTFATTTSLAGASGDLGGRLGSSVVAYNNQIYDISGVEHAFGSFPTAAAPTTSVVATASTTHNVTMPGTVAAGDLLLMFISTIGSATVTTPTGWTSIEHQSRGGNSPLGTIFAKSAAGSEGGTTVGVTTSAASVSAEQVYLVPAAKWYGGSVASSVQWSAQDPGAPTASLDPKVLAPTWGADNTLWFAYGAGNTYTTVNSYPSGFSGGVSTVTGTGATGMSTASAQLATNTASEDPGAFTMSSSNNGVAFTIAVRPAPGADAYTSSIMTATQNSDGTLGAWSTQTALGGNDLTAARAFATAQIWHNYIFVLGGRDASAAYTSIYHAQISATGTIGAWSTTTNQLSHARWGASGGIWGNWLYVTGGQSDTAGTYVTAANGVEQLTITSAGNITTASSTQNPTGQALTRLAGGFIDRGVFYTFGGYTSGSTAAVATMEWSALNSSTGALGAWSKTNIGNSITCTVSTCPTVATVTYGLSTARGETSATAADGVFYVMGGCTSTLATTVFEACTSFPATANIAEVDLDNNGATGQTNGWGSITSLPTARSDESVVAYNGKLYSLGGCTAYYALGACQTPLSDVKSAVINPDGTLSATWTSQNALPDIRSSGQAIAYNGYMYYVGGENSNGGSVYALANVWYAPIDSTGTIGTWYSGGAYDLTTAKRSFGMAISNGHIYVVSGKNAASGDTSDVQYATVNSDGTLGTWATTSSITGVRNSPSVVAYNGTLYMSGGQHTAVAFSDVQRAPINTDGSLGTWVYTTDISQGFNGRPMAAANGYMYFFGDELVAGDVDYASINANGTLGPMQQSVIGMTNSHSHGSSAFYNGNFYVLGGCVFTGGVCTTVSGASESSGQLAISRTGHYSKLFNTQVDTSPTQLVVNGAINGPGSAVELQFRTASQGDPVLGVAQLIRPVVFGNFYNVQALNSSGVNVGVAFNYQYVITLDDSRSATFPDVANAGTGYSQTAVTDITLYYHANPARRLRHGASFTNTGCNTDPTQGCILDTAP